MDGTAHPLAGEDLSDYIARLSLSPAASPSITALEDLPVVPQHLQGVLVRRAYDVTLVVICPLGLVVQLHLPAHIVPSWVSAIGAESPRVLGLLPWSSCPSFVRDMSPLERIEHTEAKLPVGSCFNVYVNAIEKQRLLLTLATKPAPILNMEAVKKEHKGGSMFKYLIVVDLEATCDWSPKPVVEFDTSEIIEFPYVVVDTDTMESVAEKQMYIKPSRMNAITPYCRVLTSITDEMVADGLPLAEAIKNFDTFVTQKYEKGSYCIISDGIWDVSCQLRQEAKRKGIPLPDWAQRYYDLKSEFRQLLPWFPFTPSDPPLHIMLQAMRLEFVGKHHRGIDDCHSIAQVVKMMLRMGHRFGQPIEIPEDYDPSRDPSFRTFASLAPPDAWKCDGCTTEHGDEECKTNPFRGVWNKPLASACRFCHNPPSGNFSKQCGTCGSQFTLTPKEMQFYQSKNWFYPKNCTQCRHSKTQIFIGHNG